MSQPTRQRPVILRLGQPACDSGSHSRLDSWPTLVFSPETPGYIAVGASADRHEVLLALCGVTEVIAFGNTRCRC